MNQTKGKRVARSSRRRGRRRAGEKKGTDFKSENQTLTLKRKPTWASTHRRQHRHRADRKTAASLPNGARDRAEIRTAPRQAVTATGHHPAAPRRRRAQPRASTHAGERALDGAALPLPRPLRTAAAAGLTGLRCGVREKERKKMNLGFRERSWPGVLISRRARAAVG